MSEMKFTEREKFSMKHLDIFVGLREKGLRLTPQREIILSVVSGMRGHVSVDKILTRVRKRYPYLNKSVVYRTLNMLTEYRILDQTDFGKGHIEYELHDHPHHHHLFCRKCGKTIQLDQKIFDGLQKQLRERYHFVASIKHFAISGWCESCEPPADSSHPRARRPSRRKTSRQ